MAYCEFEKSFYKATELEKSLAKTLLLSVLSKMHGLWWCVIEDKLSEKDAELLQLSKNYVSEAASFLDGQNVKESDLVNFQTRFEYFLRETETRLSQGHTNRDYDFLLRRWHSETNLSL